MTSSTTTLTSHSPLRNTADLRICHIRGLSAAPPTGDSASILDALDLGRLADGLRSADSLAPRLLAASHRPALNLAGRNWSNAGQREVHWQRYRVLMAGGGVADVRLISTPWQSIHDTIALLEDLHYEAIEGEPTEWDLVYSSRSPEPVNSIQPFHHLVFLPEDQDEPDWETIQRLVYRADLDAIEEHSSINHPEELNRRPGQLAAVGRFGSVVWGLQDYVESSVVLSAAMTVSAASVAGAVRRAAYEQLQVYRQTVFDHGQADLDNLRAVLPELGADLTFGAEAQATIDHLLPSLRVNSYHRAIFEAADVRAQIDLAARMLDRLAAIADVRTTSKT